MLQISAVYLYISQIYAIIPNFIDIIGIVKTEKFQCTEILNCNRLNVTENLKLKTEQFQNL